MGILKIPEPDLPESELIKRRELNERLNLKMEEYRKKFGDIFTTEFLPMSIEEIIKNIDKCIKHNKKWEGYIVPKLDEDDEV